jgi:predicted porin
MSGKQQTTIARLCAACAFSALIIGSSHARADETTNALLDLLKSKGAITQTEYDKIKARQQAEAKDSAQKLQAAETRAREAEAKAREAEAKAHEAEAKAESDSAEVAKVKAQTLTAADMPIPSKMAPKPPLEYVTALKKCVGIRVGQVDICIKGDISFFGVEQFPNRNLNLPAPINGGLVTTGEHASNSVRGGLLPSSIQVGISTNQAGWDIGAYFGVYVGGNNINAGFFNQQLPGNPTALGTAGVDFRQVFGTIGTPSFGTVKIGRDIGLFASDAILNDLTLFGVGTPLANFAPSNTTLGRIGIGYIYTDFIPQITYKSPTWGGVTFWLSAMTPLDEFAFAGPFNSGTMTAHDLPMGQAKIQYVGTWSPDVKLTLSTSGVIQRHRADCLNGSVCIADVGDLNTTNPTGNTPGFNAFEGQPGIQTGTQTTAWAVDAFAMLDLWGWNFVAYGYTGKGVGTTGLFWDGVDVFGNARRSDGGYLQAAYTFKGGWLLPNPLTVGGSWGVSHLETAGAADNFIEITNCNFATTLAPGTAGTACLVKDNQSWIAFARYNLTDWVKLQVEYTHTTAENQINTTIHDDAFAIGTTFFW